MPPLILVSLIREEGSSLVLRDRSGDSGGLPGVGGECLLYAGC